MPFGRRVLSVLAILILLPLTAARATAEPQLLTECSTEYFHNDERLGPRGLPVLGPVGRQLIGYDRTGNTHPEVFLSIFYDTGASRWRYPPADGYVIRPDGTPNRWTQELRPRQRIDRYGGEFGAFLAPEGLPYARRSIPPQNLVGMPAAGCNYHNYQVLRGFRVYTGPIAPWFFQPGGGVRYQLTADLVPGAPRPLTVQWLVDNGYLLRLS